MAEESRKGEYGYGKERKHKIRWGATFNYALVKPIANMTALGMTEKDIGLIVGVSGSTIAKWKQRYPQIKKAYDEAKSVCASHLVAQMVRSAIGYDYEEKEFYIVTDEETGEEKRKLKSIKVKHQKGEPALMTFLAKNLLPEQFTDKIQIDKRDVKLNLSGELAKDEIAGFAGKLLEISKEERPRKNIESKAINENKDS